MHVNYKELWELEIKKAQFLSLSKCGRIGAFFASTIILL